MGYEQIIGSMAVNHSRLWAGWHPYKVQNEIPGELFDESQPIGFRDCNGVVYRLGRLQKMFGYDNVTTPALQSGAKVTSLFYSPVLSKFIGTVGTKLYLNMYDAVPTDVTGTAAITAGTQVDIAEWQFETATFVIGVQQGNAPWKYDGGAAAATLAGSPPQGKWVEVWQNSCWIGNTATKPSQLAFSSLGDPEAWDANDNYNFDAPLTGLGVLGGLLVVFMEDHIGILSGTNNRLLTKIDRYINSVGCTGGFTIRNCYLQGREVLVFHGNDGFYAFDGSRQVIKLSEAIINKYSSSTSTQRWNSAKLASAWACYDSSNRWYWCGIADGSDTENGFLLILDLGKPYNSTNADSMWVPHWPASDQAEEISCITVGRDSSGNSAVYFGSDDGVVYKYSSATFNRNGTAYTGYATSKIFDAGQNILLLEANIVGTDQGTAGEITESVNFDLETGLGQADTQDMTTGGDVLDTTFVLDTSTLGSTEFVFKNFEIVNSGRFFQFDVRNTQLDEQMDIHSLNFVFKQLGLMPNAGA